MKLILGRAYIRDSTVFNENALMPISADLSKPLLELFVIPFVCLCIVEALMKDHWYDKTKMPLSLPSSCRNDCCIS